MTYNASPLLKVETRAFEEWLEWRCRNGSSSVWRACNSHMSNSYSTQVFFTLTAQRWSKLDILIDLIIKRSLLSCEHNMLRALTGSMSKAMEGPALQGLIDRLGRGSTRCCILMVEACNSVGKVGTSFNLSSMSLAVWMTSWGCCKVHGYEAITDNVTESMAKVGDENIFIPRNTSSVVKLYGFLCVLKNRICILC